MSDRSKHLTYFKVENFKRFDSFEMKDLGQFNLIVGDNNVGKTSVLEALLVDEVHQNLINNFRQALEYKKILSNIKLGNLELFANRELAIIGEKEFSIIFTLESTNNTRKIELHFNLFRQQLIFKGLWNQSPLEMFLGDSIGSYTDLSTPFIPFYKGHDSDLANNYSKYIQADPKVKRRLMDALKIIIPQFENIELSFPSSDNPPQLIVHEKEKKIAIPLGLYGEGSIKLFRILMEVIVQNKKRLMIDEMDAGIHYKRYGEFWKTIIKAAQDNEVQLFMTTHNKEFIQSFVDVLSDPGMKNLSKDARNITLIEGEDKSVKAFTYPFDELEHAITVGNEVRS